MSTLDGDEIRTNLGERLKTERNRLDLSQAALAAAVGTATRTVIQWEKGVTSPSGDVLALCSGLGIDVLFVLTGQRTPQSAQALSPEDTALLDNYHAATEDDRAVARRVLSLVAKQTQKRA